MLGLAPETMLPEKYRRLWRRRLRRRPLLPLLVLAIAMFSGAFVILIRLDYVPDLFKAVLMGCGVAVLGFASLWVLSSLRWIWFRTIAVILMLAALLAVALLNDLAPNDQLAVWSSTVVMCLLLVGGMAMLSRIGETFVAGIRYSASWVAIRRTCPHCGKSYATAGGSQLRPISRSIKLKILGLFGCTTVFAIVSAIASNTEWDHIYDGIDGLVSFLALSAIVPVVAVTTRHTRSIVWRAAATLAAIVVASLTIDFPPSHFDAFTFCVTIGVAAHVGIWLASPRPSTARKKVLAAPHAATVTVLAEPS